MPWLVVAGLAIAASAGIYLLEPRLPRAAVRRAYLGSAESAMGGNDE